MLARSPMCYRLTVSPHLLAVARRLSGTALQYGFHARTVHGESVTWTKCGQVVAIRQLRRVIVHAPSRADHRTGRSTPIWLSVRALDRLSAAFPGGSLSDALSR